MSAVAVDAQAGTFAVDDPDGVAFAGANVAEDYLAGSDGVALPTNLQLRSRREHQARRC
jgi:hypothetical protein